MAGRACRVHDAQDVIAAGCQSNDGTVEFHFQAFSLRSQITTFKFAIRSNHVYLSDLVAKTSY